MNVPTWVPPCRQGLPEKKVLQPTVPESPAFALKKRIRLEKVEEVSARLVVCPACAVRK